MIHVCEKCKNYHKYHRPTSFRTGRKLKAVPCLVHTEPFAQCDVCAVVTPMVPTSIRESWTSWGEKAGGEWEVLETGEPDPERPTAQKKVHVCSECVEAVRAAMRVAFDAAIATRDGLRKGVVLP